jgi:hypothetical protein
MMTQHSIRGRARPDARPEGPIACDCASFGIKRLPVPPLRKDPLWVRPSISKRSWFHHDGQAMGFLRTLLGRAVPPPLVHGVPPVRSQCLRSSP